jgi:hypothetical protein
MTKSELASTIDAVRADAGEIRRGLETFARSTRVFSSARARLIDRYENQWVAVYEGNVVASAASLAAVSKVVEELGLPLDATMIRRIERKSKTFIL